MRHRFERDPELPARLRARAKQLRLDCAHALEFVRAYGAGAGAQDYAPYVAEIRAEAALLDAACRRCTGTRTRETAALDAHDAVLYARTVASEIVKICNRRTKHA